MLSPGSPPHHPPAHQLTRLPTPSSSPHTQFDLGPWLAALNRESRSGHTITVVILGSTTNSWTITGNVQLWRGKQTIVGGKATASTRPAITLPLSDCLGENLTDSGECTFHLEPRQLEVSGTAKLSDGNTIQSRVAYSMGAYHNFNQWGESDSPYT